MEAATMEATEPSMEPAASMEPATAAEAARLSRRERDDRQAERQRSRSDHLAKHGTILSIRKLVPKRRRPLPPIQRLDAERRPELCAT
jgi:hypothetical protein